MTVQIDTTAENNGVRFVIQGTHPSNPSAGHVILYYVTGTASPGLFVENSSGNKYGPFITGSASGGGLSHISTSKRTAGDYTLNNTNWTNVDTGIDLVLTVQTGDIIEVGLNSLWGGEAVNCALDVATIVSGNPVNYIACAGGASDLGVQSWLGISGVVSGLGSPFLYTIQSGDISGGTVTLRLRYRTTAGANKTLRANANQPLLFYAFNLSR